MPWIVELPAVGLTSPSSIRSVVVLPAPLGPRKPTIRPSSTVKDRSSTASTSPKRLVRFETSIACAIYRTGPALGTSSSEPSRVARVRHMMRASSPLSW